MSQMIANRRLWRTKSGDVVLDGDPDAAVLIAAAGDVVPAKYDVDPAWLAGGPADADADQRSVVLGNPEKPEPAAVAAPAAGDSDDDDDAVVAAEEPDSAESAASVPEKPEPKTKRTRRKSPAKKAPAKKAR